MGAPGGRPRRGLSRRYPGTGALRARPSDLAHSACGQPWHHRRHHHRRHRRPGGDPVSGGADDLLLDVADITEIELLVQKRMREVATGEHRGVFHGPGFELLGVREWQPGDRASAIDWAQSSMTNFSPVLVREFEQPSTATVLAIADRSPSTRCGRDGVLIGGIIARALATIGFSAAFFQDAFGMLTVDGAFEPAASVRPAVGRNNVVHCLDAYCARGRRAPSRGTVGSAINGIIRREAMVVAISDFLFD